MRPSISLLIALFCVSLTSCTERATPPVKADAQDPPRIATTPTPSVDACTLLTSEEIEAVQGEPVKEGKPLQRPDRGLVMSECFLALPTFTNSVSFTVGRKGDTPDARNPAEYWNELFSEKVLAASEKSPPPKKLDGLGEAAYWTGNSQMGAVHVLSGAYYLRISVGGPGDQEEKIKRCRALLEAALKRL